MRPLSFSTPHLSPQQQKPNHNSDKTEQQLQRQLGINASRRTEWELINHHNTTRGIHVHGIIPPGIGHADRDLVGVVGLVEDGDGSIAITGGCHARAGDGDADLGAAHDGRVDTKAVGIEPQKHVVGILEKDVRAAVRIFRRCDRVDERLWVEVAAVLEAWRDRGLLGFN